MKWTTFLLRLPPLVVLGALLVTCPGAAQSTHDSAAERSEPAGYRESILLAIEEYGAHNYPEARAQFRRAHALSPSARTLRGLGLTEYELRNYGECARLLRQALSSPVRPLDPTQRQEVEKVLQRARDYLGKLTLLVVPAASSVLLDGQQRELDADHALMVEIGNHVLEVSAPGRTASRRTVHIMGGEEQVLTVELPPLVPSTSGTDTRAPLAQERDPTRPALYQRWWVWTALGATVVSAGVITALVLLRPSEVQTEPNRTATTPEGPPFRLGATR